MPPKKKNANLTFTYDGETYTLPAMDDWPSEFQEYHEEGKWVAATKAVIGDEAYNNTFKKKKRTMKELMDFVEAVLTATEKAEGLEEGESDGS